jgi:hypothetical protein
MMWNGTLAELAGFAESPTTDGVLGEWVRTRANAPFTAQDVPAIAALLRAPDPHLQEAGIELATAALHGLDASAHDDAGPTRGLDAAALEPHLVALATFESDPYVLEALVALLEEHAMPGLFATLAHLEPLAPSRFPPPVAPTSYPPPRAARARFILRNRMAEPWRRFRALVAARDMR